MSPLLHQLSNLAFNGLLLLLILITLRTWLDTVQRELCAPAALPDFERDDDFLPGEWLCHDHPTAEEMEAWCLAQG